jgi:heme/copper-type cytochrome/quinol oxidase subunit 3
MAASDTPADGPSRLRHLRAAQLRIRAIRGALVKGAFGTVFLVGAIAHALSPQRHEQSSLFWISLLLLMSTINVGLGLRALARARRLRGRAWLWAAGVWGSLSLVLLGLLLRR